MVSRARNFASFAKSMEDKTFVGSSISGTATKTGTINIPLDTEDFTDYQIGQSSTAGKMVDPTTGNVTLTFPQANNANKKFTLHFELGYDNTFTNGVQGKIHNQRHQMSDEVYGAHETYGLTYRAIDFDFNNDGTIGYLIENEWNDRVYQFPLREKYNITSAIKDVITLGNAGLNVESQVVGETPYAYSNSDNGYDNNVGEWKITRYTYLYNGAPRASTDFYPTGIAWKPDGTRMYTIGSSTDAVTQYDLSTAWDITTAAEDTSGISYNFSSQDAYPYRVRFKPDGTRMFVGGLSSNTIHIYSLSTAWDTLSTVTYLGNIGITINDGQAFDFSPDGRFLYWHMDDQRGLFRVYDVGAGNEWNFLSTEWDDTPSEIGSQYTGNRVSQSRTFGRDLSYTAPYTLRAIDNHCVVMGDPQSHKYMVYEIGDNYAFNIPSNVQDPMPRLFRGYRYQIDFTSSNADSASAKWFISDIRSLRV